MQIHCDFCPATANEPEPFNWGTITLEGFIANPKVVYHQCPHCRTKFIEDMHKAGVRLKGSQKPEPAKTESLQRRCVGCGEITTCPKDCFSVLCARCALAWGVHSGSFI
jgi:ferredoxin